MLNALQIRDEYSMRDAEVMEDRLILLILKKMNCVYAGRLLRLVEALTLPVILFVLAAVTFYVLKNKLSLYILLAPLGILSVYIPSAIGSMKTRRQNSGIRHDIKRCGEHFLIAQATCIGKNEQTFFSGKKLCSLKVGLRGGQRIESIPIFEPYYRGIKVGSEVALIISSSEGAEVLFAIPKYVLKPHTKTAKLEADKTAPISEELLRPLSEEDRKMALEFGAYRNRLRVIHYGRAYIICSLLSAAFFVTAVILNSVYINLSIVILCCIAAAVVMYFAEWRQYKKMVLEKWDKLSCLDGKVSTKTEDSENKGKYIEIEDLGGKRIFRSTSQEDYIIFEKGSPVLLIYKDGKDKPIICMKSLPA